MTYKAIIFMFVVSALLFSYSVTAGRLPTDEEVNGIMKLCGGGRIQKVDGDIKGKIEIWMKQAEAGVKASIQDLGAIIGLVPANNQLNNDLYNSYIKCINDNISKFLSFDNEGYDSIFQENYMRLFGALQVPVLIDIIKSGGISRDAYGSLKVKNGIYIAGDVINFWSNWEYKNALLIKNDSFLWISDPGNIDNMYWTLSHLSKKDVACYFYNMAPEYDGEPIGSKNIDISEEYKLANASYCNKKVLDIGYLFFIIKNTSKKQIKNISITYKEYGDSFSSVINNRNEWGIVEKSNLFQPTDIVESGLRDAKEVQKIIPYIDSGRSLLWLIAVYLKDNNGLPYRYIGNVTDPIKINYHVEGNEFTQNFRKPLKDKAMKIDVPYGWYHQ